MIASHFFLLLGFAAIVSEASAQPNPTPGITPITSPDGVYSVTFPCRPAPRPVPGADAALGTSQALACNEGDFAATVAAHRFVVLPDPASMDAKLRDEMASMIPGGKLTRDEVITRNGQVGRAIRVQGTTDILNALIFVEPASRHVFQVFAMMPRDRKVEARIATFLDSFRFLKPPVVTPAPSLRSVSFLQVVAAESNKSLPSQIDSITELSNLTALEGILTYNYRLVTMAVAEVDPARLLNRVRPAITIGWCGEAQLRQYLDQGVTLRAVYSDKDRNVVTSFDVTQKDCP